MTISEKTWIRTIAILEIVGGVVGILFMIYAAITTEVNWVGIVIIPISTGVFVLSLVAGIYLWKDTEFGRKASIVTQFIQLPKLVSPMLTFTFSFGFDLYPHLTFSRDLWTVGLQFRFLAEGQIFVNTATGGLLLGISVPAILALIRLWNYMPGAVSPDGLSSEMKPPQPEQYLSLRKEDD